MNNAKPKYNYSSAPAVNYLIGENFQLIQCSRKHLIHFLLSLYTKCLQHTESIDKFLH